MTKSPITRNNLQAARALTAQSLKDVATAVGADYWTISDFEQGIQDSLGDYAKAVEQAMGALGVRFEPDGSIAVASAPTPPPPGVGAPFRWIEAQDLANWGGTRDGQEGLPELVGRLILATVGPAAKIRFPAGDSVLFAGWDGFCTIGTGSGNVPDGVSVWEIGAQRTHIREKADEDYKKRSEGPTTVDRKNTTFVFVTPQRWPRKENWRQSKLAEGIWREISVIDGDDLVHWLDLCPGVSRWLSIRIAKRRNDLRDIGGVFDEWTLATDPPLSVELLLGDRDEQATQIRRWLNGSPSVLTMQAESTEEATAFLRAVIDPLPIPYRLYWESRILVAESSEAARGVAELSAKLVIVLAEGDPGLAASLVKQGHHVFAAQGAEAGGSRETPRLTRPWKSTIRRALEKTGLERHKAQVLAGDCGRSLTVLRRLMPASPGKKPSWTAGPISPSLIAAMLAGSWESSYPVDREIMARLSGRKYADFEADLAAFAGFDGPLRRSGSAWKLTSLRDAWFLIADRLSSHHVDTLVESFLGVLSADDPSYDAPAESQWIVPERPPDHASTLLRHGLAEAMIALAVFPERVSSVPDARYRSERSVRMLLQGADQRRWWCLSNDFRLLAEISPEALLDALEHALGMDPSPIMSLFRSDEGFLHKIEYLADLLWALEILAWSRDYLGRVALVLARLIELDPGGNFGNRPDATLRRIFLPWLPQTFASKTERMEVIDAMISQYPSVGWNLLVLLAPDVHSVTEPSAFPTWRDFSAEDAAHAPDGKAVSESYREIGARMLASAGTDPDRWSDMLDHWNRFGAQWRKEAEIGLSAAIDTVGPGQRDQFREMLRQVIGKHEQFPEAKWTLKADALLPLKALYARLESADPIARHAWLFGAPTFRHRNGRAWHELEEEAEAERRTAAESILKSSPPDAVIAMARSVRIPRLLGGAIAAAAVPDELKDDLLERALADADLEEFARAMLFVLLHARGEPWLLERFAKGAARKEDPDLLVRLALALAPTKRNWEAIESAGADIALLYWKRIDEHVPDSDADPGFVIDKLLSVDRGRAAMTWVGAHPKMTVSARLVASILGHASTISGGDDVDDGVMYQHYATELFKRLDADASFPSREIAGLEWTYYRLLEHSQRPPRCLNDVIAADPRFFVYLLASGYPAENDDDALPDESENARKIGKQARHVLSGWSVVPGSRPDGEIDADTLGSWVEEVRKLAKESRRVAVSESKIGTILAKAPGKDGQPWPPEAVRRIIETSKSKELEDGFFIAVRNSRGVTVRRPTDGGSLERDAAAAYRSQAKAVGVSQVRTRALLNKIAESYELQADEEDRSAEQRDW